MGFSLLPQLTVIIALLPNLIILHCACEQLSSTSSTADLLQYFSNNV